MKTQKKMVTSLSKKIWIILFCGLLSIGAQASSILIPMDEDGQKNHLKAYGIAYWSIELGHKINWLLNYRGGSFLIPHHDLIAKECAIRGVSYELISDAETNTILEGIRSPSQNQDVALLEKAPRIAVYSPKESQPWDDAVTLALSFAEIPYDVIYDDEIMRGDLKEYDWLHLHHEDFTGQYGRFYHAFRNAPWYILRKKKMENSAKSAGFTKVSQHKLAVALTIKAFVAQGGFLFAMCSATDTFDIALAAEGTDICEAMFDGDPSQPGYQRKLNFNHSLAFENFILSHDPSEYEFSNIDVTQTRNVGMEEDYFMLFDFSAKWDPVPSMLCQNHVNMIKGFMGQTTAFHSSLVKKNVLILGQNPIHGEAKYIHGTLGQGMWTYYGGHDPEDYQHRVGDPKTDLELHPNSPGYRLILNNILFPAARKKEQKT